ncbi:unnamed protein product [Rhodiola kirilowii]
MCPHKTWFENMSEHALNERVFMGNHNACEVKGIGTVRLSLDNGKQVLLSNVRYVPGLRRNLISLGALDDSGCSYTAENGSMHVYKNNKCVLTGSKMSGLYILNGVCCNAAYANVEEHEDTVKWHFRLGHISHRGLTELGKQGILDKAVINDLPFCECCVLAKQHKLSSSAGVHLSKHVLDYVHADLWGPEGHETHGGNKYFMSIVDDFSRFVWTFLLKSKSDAFSKFKDWKALEENQTSCKLKALRTDNGLEFCNDEFDSFCKSCGILRHKTVRATPQQNGVAERMNRTLLEKVRALLFTSGVPKAFWGEALAAATYIVNRCPNRSLSFKCPVEIWTKRKPDLKHLRIFGCAAYAHNREGKLDPRSLRCVFLGYQPGTKGYRLWERNTRGVKIIVSKDVVFNEVVFPCKQAQVAPAQPSEPSTSNEVESSLLPLFPATAGGQNGDQPLAPEPDDQQGLPDQQHADQVENLEENQDAGNEVEHHPVSVQE